MACAHGCADACTTNHTACRATPRHERAMHDCVQLRTGPHNVPPRACARADGLCPPAPSGARACRSPPRPSPKPKPKPPPSPRLEPQSGDRRINARQSSALFGPRRSSSPWSAMVGRGRPTGRRPLSSSSAVDRRRRRSSPSLVALAPGLRRSLLPVALARARLQPPLLALAHCARPEPRRLVLVALARRPCSSASFLALSSLPFARRTRSSCGGPIRLRRACGLQQPSRLRAATPWPAATPWCASTPWPAATPRRMSPLWPALSHGDRMACDSKVGLHPMPGGGAAAACKHLRRSWAHNRAYPVERCHCPSFEGARACRTKWSAHAPVWLTRCTENTENVGTRARKGTAPTATTMRAQWRTKMSPDRRAELAAKRSHGRRRR